MTYNFRDLCCVSVSHNLSYIGRSSHSTENSRLQEEEEDRRESFHVYCMEIKKFVTMEAQ